MKMIVLAAITGIATQLPTIIADFKKTVSDAESNEDVKDKVTALINDLINFLKIVEGVL